MRNRVQLTTVAAFALICCTTVSTVMAAQESGLLELYTLAREKDPAIGRSEARREASKADAEVAVSALLPHIDANAAIRRIRHSVENYGPQEINGKYIGSNYGFGLRLPIITPPSYFQITAASAGVRSADAGNSAVRQELMTRVTDAYVRLLKVQADERLYRDEMLRVSQVLEQADAFLKAGTGDIIAVYEARARLDSAAADLVKIENQRRLAEQSLSTLAGIPVTGIRDLGQQTPAGPQPAELQWWIDTMYKNQPNLLQAKEDMTQAEEYSSASKAAHLPTVQASMGYAVDKGSTFLPLVETRQWYIGVNVSVPIYSGGETSARTRRAVAGESERRFMLDEARNQSLQKLKEAFLNLEYNVTSVGAMRRKLESAELQLNAVKKGREIGTRTAIDLLNSEQSYAVSRRDLTSALYDNLLYGLQLKVAAGVASVEDLSDISNLSTVK